MLQTIEKEIEWFKPLEKNVRKHTESQINALIKSIESYGVTRPLVCDEEGNVLVGNGLYMALKAMGKTSASTIVINGLTETQKKKLIITDNHIYDLGFTNSDVQMDFLRDILAEGDMDIAGFDDTLLRALKDEMSIGDDKVIEELDKDMFTLSEEDAKNIEKQKASFVVPSKTNDTPIPNNQEEKRNAPEPFRVASQPNEIKEEEYVEFLCPHCGEKIKVKINDLYNK